MKVCFINNLNEFKLKNKAKILKLSEILNLNLDFVAIFLIDNKEILDMNLRFLSHNYYTDILTFDLRDDSKKDVEIYISYEMASENAKRYNCSIENEIRRLIIHGFLHLAGFNDDKEKNKKEMREKENYFLSTLFHVKTNEE